MHDDIIFIRIGRALEKMIYGIGTDIFEVRRIKEAIEQDSGFIKSIFTEDEIRYCEKMASKSQHYAARFSAKEAFMKALGTGWRNGIGFTNISIINDELGKPYIKLEGKAKEIVEQEGISALHVTLSHTKEMATAFVVLESDFVNK